MNIIVYKENNFKIIFNLDKNLFWIIIKNKNIYIKLLMFDFIQWFENININIYPIKKYKGFKTIENDINILTIEIKAFLLNFDLI